MRKPMFTIVIVMVLAIGLCGNVEAKKGYGCDCNSCHGFASQCLPNTPPVANPGDQYIGTVNEPVTFNGSGSTDPDGTIVSYDWDFGDGSIGEGPTPLHTYAADGNYTVTLTVTDDSGGTAWDTTTANIGPGNRAPIADAGGPYSGTVNEPVEFVGTGSSDLDGDIVDYQWDFGDDSTGAGPTPNHTYTTDGQFTVTLIVTDDAGDTGSYETTVTIGLGNQAPNANANGPYNGLVNEEVSFDGSSSADPDGSIATYDWDFGDGNSATGAMPTHTYISAGTYNVTLTVTDDKGATDSVTISATIVIGNQGPSANANGPYNSLVDEAVSFDSSGSSDPDGTIVAYDWNFGDGSSSNGSKATHTYTTAGTYNITLTVTDDAGDTSMDTTTATIGLGNQAPIADANNPYIGTVGVPLDFNGSHSSDPDGDIVAYDWEFGDGSTGTGVTPTHTYTAAGTYTVTLTVTDDMGATDSTSRTATIGQGNQAPIADANNPYNGTVGIPLDFDGSHSSDPDGDIVAYEWNFGDGSTGTGVTSTHTYTSAGTYNVTLTVTDDKGATDSISRTATIIEQDNQAPIADANNPYNGTVGVPLNFNGSHSSDPDGDIVAYEWDFGDGSTGSGVTPTHTYTAAGTYTVSLTVTDDMGATDSTTRTATIIQHDTQPPEDVPGEVDGDEDEDESDKGIERDDDEEEGDHEDDRKYNVEDDDDREDDERKYRSRKFRKIRRYLKLLWSKYLQYRS